MQFQPLNNYVQIEPLEDESEDNVLTFIKSNKQEQRLFRIIAISNKIACNQFLYEGDIVVINQIHLIETVVTKMGTFMIVDFGAIAGVINVK